MQFTFVSMRNHLTIRAILSALALAVSPLSYSATDVRFQKIDDAPIQHQYTGGWEHFVGGGISSFDCDGDSYPELYLAGGSASATLLKNNTSAADGSLRFTPQTPKSLALKHVTGSYPLDIDSDGLLDLVVLRNGKNLLLRAEGDCKFSRFPESLGFQSEASWTTAFSASWEGKQRLPTLAFGNYVDLAQPNGPFEACDDNWLYRPETNRYRSVVKLTPGYCTLSMLYSDWGRNGRMDLRISNDRHYYVKNGAEQLWAMDDVPRLYSEQEGWIDFSLWGMGIASRDLTGDGYPEIFLTSMGDQKLQYLDRSADGPSYTNAGYETGSTAHRPYIGDDGRPSTGWHAEFADFNNDGFDDLFIAKGNVEQMLSSAVRDPNNLLMQNRQGRFEEQGLTAGIASMEKSRGASVADLNLDGLPDLAVLNRNAAVEIYQNKSNSDGHWLLLSLTQPGVNTYAIGSWIEVRANDASWHREITVGGGHAGGSLGYHHFGLGDATSVRLRVTWPDGVVSDWLEINTNHKASVTRVNNNGLAVNY